MFGQPRDHHEGGPPRYNNGNFPGLPVGMTAGAPYQPSNARGRGGGGGGGGAPGPYHLPPFSGPGTYQGYPAPNYRPLPSGLAHPPPPPGSPPLETPPPPSDGSVRSGPNWAPPSPPPAPKDAEMLKNIEVLSAFVARNGPRFENMAREKHGDNPKFAFLFGGERGTEAAIGSDFYEWKKVFLAWEERSKLASAEHLRSPDSKQQGNRGEVVSAQLSHEVPTSPAGSDMDMEDDFALTPPTSERKPTFERGPVVPSPKRERRSGFSSGFEFHSQASERKAGPTSPGFERSRFSSPPSDKKQVSASATAERTPQGNLAHQVLESKAGASSSGPVDQEPSQQGNNKWRSAPSGTSDVQNLGVGSEKGSQVPDASKVERESFVSELPRRRDSRRRTGFDRPCMEDVSPQSSPPRFGEPKENQRESAASVELERKGVPPNGHSEVLIKPSRWGPPESGPGHHGNRDLVSDKGPGTGETSSLTRGYQRSDASHHRGEESVSKDRSQSPKVSGKPPRANDDISARDTDKPKSRSGSDSLAVDEFGRLLRQGGSDSDGEGHHGGGKKRRRSMSRSRTRSRSPGDLRRKRWSPSRSPRRRGRRSRSWSGSPRRQRSRSRTPPREGRWAGEGRGERGFFDRGGRRWGRGGGPPSVCNNFLRGRCQRGASCRFSHEESNGLADDQGGRWGGGRGRGRGRGRSGRETAEDGDRNCGGKGGEPPRPCKTWNSNERNTDDDSREKKLIEVLNKQDAESSDESWEQKKGDKATAPGSTATEQGVSVENLPLKSSKETAVSVTSQQQVKTSSDYMCEALSPSATFPLSQSNQGGQQTSGLSNPVSSPQQPSYSSPITHPYNNSLGSHVPQHSSFSMSPSAQPQQLKYTIGHHPQQNVFPSSHQSGYSANVPHKSVFGVNRPHQQTTFLPPPVSYSQNPSMPTQQQQQQVPFSSLPILRPQPSFSSPQQQNFAPISMPMSMSVPTPMPMSVPLSSSHSALMSRTPSMNAPPQMLQVPMGTNLTTRFGYSWTTPVMTPPVSYGLPAQQPLQQPPPPPPQPQTQSLAPQAPPPQVLVPPPIPYQYPPPLPPTYAAASYSTIAAQVMAPSSISSSEQYDPLADSLEPGPPGAGDKKGLASFNQTRQQDDGSRQTAGDQWKLHSAGENTPLMTNAGEVVLENVSPGLPGHMENVRSNIVVLENVSPRRPMHMVMENVSPTNVGSSFNVNTSSMKYSGSQVVTMESVSPCPDTNLTGDGHKDPAHASKDQKKKDKDGRILNLIRKAVAEHVKDLLKPTWKEGQMSKDAFKTIAKKAVDKVMGALEAKGSIPKSQEKLDLFMDTSKPKIAKLVQGYVDKYVKA